MSGPPFAVNCSENRCAKGVQLRRVVAILAVLAALLVSVTPGRTQTLDGDLEVLIGDALQPYVAARDFMGVVAIGRDGHSPVIVSRGSSDLGVSRPHKPDGVFRIGSVSKQFTAVGILLLAEAGDVGLNAPVSEYLPGFPRGDGFTIHQLLTHTAGVADVYSLPGLRDGEAGRKTLQDVVGELADAGLVSMPGEGFAYSNGGYSLLAAIIERVSGMSYGDFLEQRVFAPLQLESTSHSLRRIEPARRVTGLVPQGTDRLTSAPALAEAYLTGSGSLWSTADDLLRWAEALHNGDLLAEASYRQMIRDHGAGYGYGMSVFRRLGRDVIGHDGRVSGYASDLATYVNDGLHVVVLSNVESVARDEIRVRLAAAALGMAMPEASAREFVDGIAAPVDATGSYSFGPSLTVQVFIDRGRLLARANSGAASELVPLTTERWFSRMLYTEVCFGRGDDGAVDTLLWGCSESGPVGQRIDGRR